MSNTDTKLLQEIADNLKQMNRNPNRSAFGSGGTFDPKPLVETSGKVTSVLGKLGTGALAAATGLSAFVSAVEDGLDPWRAAGKHGATFGNDVVGMSLSATKARLNMSELADIVRANTAGFAGLGGTVGKGAKAFTEMSKKFFEADQGYADELRALGYTNKELNDVLALQITMQRHSMKLDEDSQRKHLKAAHELAKEMDSLARLTGKSREQQMAEMQEAALNSQVEARFQIMKQQNPEMDIDAARNQYLALYNAAQGDAAKRMVKEMFAQDGLVTSRDAVIAASLAPEIASVVSQATADIRNGTLKSIEETTTGLHAATVKSLNNPALLQLATLSPELSDVGGTLENMRDSSVGLRVAVNRLSEAAGGLKTSAELLKDAIALIKTEQKTDGKVTGQYTQMTGRLTDTAAATASGIERIYNSESVNNLINRLETFTTHKSPLSDGTIVSYARALDTIASKSLVTMDETTGKLKSSFDTMVDNANTLDTRVKIVGTTLATTFGAIHGAAYVTDNSLKAIGTTYNEYVKPAIDGLTEAGGKLFDVVQKGFNDAGLVVPDFLRKNTEGRSKGSLGETGNLFENWGSETLVRLHGVEGVVRPQDMENMAKGFKSEGYNLAFRKLASVMESVKLPILQPPEKPYSDFNPDFEKRFDGIEQTMSGTIADFEQMTSSVESSFSAMGDEAFKSFDDILETPGTIESKVASIGAVFGDVLGKITPEIQKTIKASSDTVFSIGKVLEKHSQAPRVPKDLRQQIELNIPKQPQSEQRQAEQPREIKSADSIKQYQAPITIDKSSLTPIVENLEKLNIQVTSLIEQQADLARKQVSAIEKHSKVIR